ncbi:MAG: hypothetical protein Q7J31_03210 [Syntrophales bacterium]|nr:hypothetical protein [Syntrophales bacterium]
METKLKMVYCKGDKLWIGKLLEHPEIMTQVETLEELEENMKDAYMLMAMEDVPEHHEVRYFKISPFGRNDIIDSFSSSQTGGDDVKD